MEECGGGAEVGGLDCAALQEKKQVKKEQECQQTGAGWGGGGRRERQIKKEYPSMTYLF